MRIIVKRDDGGVSILIPAKGTSRERLEQDALNEPRYISHSVVNTDEVPTDRYFRDAWEDNNAAIVVNMPKARNIQMDKLRIERNAKLAELDAPYLKADETGDLELKSSIAVKKQQLRDMPQTFDLSVYETPEELKAARPEYL